ncbi:hypothetical protein [Blastochloris sulfoviridis]|uniref:Uncharacterized protein n=1 Tax=Blastochloris sulfoviridis TaxID=50712 RepID=A0A5M6HKE6_9HYPH|nr:hypothetical protein [Blastochloris sulfoviridis]KAA5596287.1 hypothetical protein F1193_15565 [Blastochloris sulfoviridis]
MCDYSLHHVMSRPAKVGETLVATTFINSITRGFAAAGDPDVAVCLLPGTELGFDKPVEFEPGFGAFANRTAGSNLARFRQINMDNPYLHHDALEFPDGQVVLVTHLCAGQRATVLQLPAGAAVEEHRREASVDEVVAAPVETAQPEAGPPAEVAGARHETEPHTA